MTEKKKDLPAFPFYIGDWKKDPAIQVLTREYQMIWLDMLFLMWESSERGYLTINNRPMTDEMLQGALKLSPEKLQFCLTYFGEQLGLYSRREDGAIYSRKIVKILALSKTRKNAGSMGGNPLLVNQNKKFGYGVGYPNAENEIENEIENESDLRDEVFEKFWNLYDKKVGDRKKIIKKFNKLKEEDIDKIFETLPAYISSTPDKAYRKNPETYLNNHSWDDEIINLNNYGKQNKIAGNTKQQRIGDATDSIEELIRNVTK